MNCLQAVLGVGVSIRSQAMSVIKDVPKDLSQAAQKGCRMSCSVIVLSLMGLTLGGHSIKASLCHIAPPGT